MDHTAILIEGIVFDDTTIGIAVESLSDGLKLSDSSGEPVMTYLPLAADTIVFDDDGPDQFTDCIDHDYTTFTVVDIQENITSLTADQIDFVGLGYHEMTYVYKDIGVDALTSFKIDFVFAAPGSSIGSYWEILGLSNVIGDSLSFGADSIIIYGTEGASGYTMAMRHNGGAIPGVQIISGWPYNPIDPVYGRLVRIGKFVQMGFFSDEARTIQMGSSQPSKIGSGTPYQYLYNIITRGAGGDVRPTTGYVKDLNYCSLRKGVYAKAEYKATSSDGLVLSDATEQIITFRGYCSDAIVFNDTATVRVDFGVVVNDTFVFNEYQQVAWPVELEQGIKFGDSVIWIRPYDKDEIDVQPKGLDYTFKALAKITNFTAFKKQFATDAFDLSIPIAINIHPQETEFKALSKPFDFKAQPKDFNTEV
jgi:hypothetical protein